jgi:hypothetical protein
MGMKKCVVVASGEATREILAEALKAKEFEAVLLPSLAELHHTLETTRVSGILLELKSAIVAHERDKVAARPILGLYPSARFRCAGNQILIAGETLDGFVERCQRFQPRPIRRSERKERYIAVYLATDETFNDAEKSVTVNVSDKGLFVYSVREWAVGSRVWLRALRDEVVVCGIVCSNRPWGNNVNLPGIGLQIESGESSAIWKDEIVPNSNGGHSRMGTDTL